MDTEKRPLITVCLLAYKQERFIEKAVQGALAQTYEPLEIILSDDHSPDRTFEIIQRLAREYKGPHRVVVNRNRENLNLGKHFNRLFEMARGEWIVAMAGDDYSFPDRVEKQYLAAVRHPEAKAIAAAWNCVDENGNRLETDAGHQGRSGEVVLSRIDLNARCPFAVRGCGVMWHRSLFDIFGPMKEGVFVEDNVYTLRALLTGTVVAIPDVLLNWTVGPNKPKIMDYKLDRASEMTPYEQEVVNRGKQHIKVAEQGVADVNCAFEKGLITKEKRDNILGQLKIKRFREYCRGYWWEISLFTRIGLILKGIALHDGKWVLSKWRELFGLSAYHRLSHWHHAIIMRRR